jgi:uncharacterized protein
MHFILTAWDGTDEGALARRLAAREAHLVGVKALFAQGTLVFAGAMLDDAGKMIGSTVIFSADTKEQVEALVRADPYVSGNVWQRWEVRPFRLAPLQG